MKHLLFIIHTLLNAALTGYGHYLSEESFLKFLCAALFCILELFALANYFGSLVED